MFLSTTSTNPANHPRSPTPTSDVQLPRGECGFIIPAPEPGRSRQRCSCRSFYPTTVVRSQCGCGHQAWHHESQPPYAAEYTQVLEEVKRLKQELKRHENFERDLKQELFKEKMAREDHFRIYKAIEARMYENMQILKVQMDDKVEAVVDKTQEFNDQIMTMRERLTMVDEVTMDLENRIDRVELHGGYSREATPGPATPKVNLSTTPKPPPVPQIPLLMQSQHMLGQLPIRTDKKYPLSWSVRVIFVLRKSQQYAYDPDSNGYRRCASRKLQQNLDFPSQDSSCFANRIETAYKGILRGRPWMPMSAHRPADEHCH